jgi:hypothetical protein
MANWRPASFLSRCLAPSPLFCDDVPMSQREEVGREAEAQRRKVEAEKVVEAALDLIENGDVELDAWQRAQLAGAINSIFRGAYLLALTQARLALVVDHSDAGIELDPQIADMDVARFRKVLAEAQAEPARAFPHFGPWL